VHHSRFSAAPSAAPARAIPPPSLGPLPAPATRLFGLCGQSSWTHSGRSCSVELNKSKSALPGRGEGRRRAMALPLSSLYPNADWAENGRRPSRPIPLSLAHCLLGKSEGDGPAVRSFSLFFGEQAKGKLMIASSFSISAAVVLETSRTLHLSSNLPNSPANSIATFYHLLRAFNLRCLYGLITQV